MRCKYCNRQYRYVYEHYNEIVLVCKQHLDDCIESDAISQSKYESEYKSEYRRLMDEE